MIVQPAEPVRYNAKPATYETSDKDPVMPRSKAMAQRSSLERGEPGIPYAWNPESYRQDTVQSIPGKPNPYVPKLGSVEHMSTMADAVTQTNEIYGPRVPKMVPSTPDSVASQADSRIYPNLYSPFGVRKKSGPGTDSAGGVGSGVGSGVSGPKAPSGDLALLKSAPGYVPISGMKIPDNIPKTEPVPFLNDFSKFYR